MHDLTHHIAKDCSPFEDSNPLQFEEIRDVLLSEKASSYCFPLSIKENDPDEYLVNFDYKRKAWVAGRYVGEAIIQTSTGPAKVTIKPRYGQAFLFHLLEEIFNVKFSDSASSITKEKDDDNWIKRIIATIWVKMLADANKHGLPRTKKRQTHRGTTIRGRLDVRQSMRPYFQAQELVSHQEVKQIDPVIGSILSQAFRLLTRDYGLNQASIPPFASEAIHELSSFQRSPHRITANEYHRIKYNQIYISFKPIVDLSWHIISKKDLSNQPDINSKVGSALFFDMAELWEIYLRSLLKKHFQKEGWKVYSEKWLTYENQFFKRNIIPDIIMEKENDLMIWDAKYKSMQGIPFDVDRTDYFQIHTYLQMFSREKNVLGGGLLYPLQAGWKESKSSSNYLFYDQGPDMAFAVDGVSVEQLDEENTEEINKQYLLEAEEQFLNRTKIIIYSTNKSHVTNRLQTAI